MVCETQLLFVVLAGTFFEISLVHIFYEFESKIQKQFLKVSRVQGTRIHTQRSMVNGSTMCMYSCYKAIKTKGSGEAQQLPSWWYAHMYVQNRAKLLIYSDSWLMVHGAADAPNMYQQTNTPTFLYTAYKRNLYIRRLYVHNPIVVCICSYALKRAPKETLKLQP